MKRGDCVLHSGAAAEGLEADVTDDLRFGINLDVQPHDIAALFVAELSASPRSRPLSIEKETYSRCANETLADG